MRRFLGLIGLWLLVCGRLRGDEPAPPPPTRDQERAARTAIEGVIRDYFKAYESRDIAAAMAHWSDDAPDRDDRRMLLQSLFETTENIQLKRLEFERIKLDEQPARVYVRVELTGQDIKTQRPSPQMGTFPRKLELVAAEKGYRILRYGPYGSDDADFRKQLFAARNSAELRRILESEYDDDAAREQALGDIFAFHASREERLRLLHNDPYQVLATKQNVVAGNARIWETLTSPMHYGVQRAVVERLLELVTDLADFLDDPESQAWCRLSRALWHLLANESAAANAQASAAGEDFQRLALVEGQAAARLIQGRALIAAGKKDEAAVAFDDTDRLFSSVIFLGREPDKTLGETWALELGEIDRLLGQIDAGREREDWKSAREAAAEAIRREALLYGPWHPRLVEAVGHAGHIALCEGDYALAVRADEKALEIARRVFDQHHPQVASCQCDLDYDRELIALPEAAQGTFSESMRASVRAMALHRAGKYQESLPVWDESIQLRRQALGERHLYLATLYFARGKTHRAAKAVAAALADFESAERNWDASQAKYNQEHRELLTVVAEVRTNRAHQSMSDDDLDAAIASRDEQMRANADSDQLAARTHVVDSRHAIELLRRLREMSELERAGVKELRAVERKAYRNRESDWRKFIVICEPIVAEWSELFGESSSFVVDGRVQLSTAYRRNGENDKSLDQLQRLAKTMQARGDPLDGSAWATLRLLLGTAYADRGDLRQASDELSQAAEGMSRAVRGNTDTYLGVLFQLSKIRLALGDIAGAEKASRRGILLAKRRILPKQDPDYYGPKAPIRIDPELIRNNPDADVYLLHCNQFALIFLQAGDHAQALRGFEAVADMAEHLPDRPDGRAVRRGVRNHLALTYYSKQRFDRAEALLRQAYEEDLQSGRRDATQGFSLASVLHAQGKVDEALLLYEALLPRLSEILPPNRAWALSNHGHCLAAAGRPLEACASLEQALTLYDQQLEDLFSFRSESGMQGVWTEMRDTWSALVQLASAPDATTREIESAWNWSLRTKGRALEMLIRYRQGERLLRDDPRVAELSSRVDQLRGAISDLAINPPPNISKHAITSRIDRLQVELNELSGELNRRSVDALAPLQRVTLGDLRRGLEDGSALIEIVRFRPVDFRHAGSNNALQAARYVALVASAGEGRALRVVDLGEAEEIDEAIESVRLSIERFPDELRQSSEAALEQDYQHHAKRFHSQTLAPVLAAAGGPKRIYLIAEGEFQRIALETLVDDQDRYLVENTQFVYLTSAADLVRKSPDIGSGTVVLAGPDFDSRLEERQQTFHALAARIGREPKHRPGALPSGVKPGPDTSASGGGGWKPLPHAAAELKVVSDALADGPYAPVLGFASAEASEDLLKSLPAPRVLHIATHGFFLEDLAPVSESSGARGPSGSGLGVSRLVKQKNPFLRSGLILAGANRLGKEPATAERIVDDGWVTAEEIASLDLRGTELVVLSACQTGLGDVRIGDGVHGLRRALLYAGARSLMTSLYRVDDAATRELMQQFYSGLKAGHKPHDSLRAAELELLQKRRDQQGPAHPYYWGSFIFVGNPH